MKQRLREFDFLRAVAAVSVIAIHVTAVNEMVGRLVFISNQAVRYAVPLFILMSGLLLFFSDREVQKVAYGEFLIKRFRKILIPYIIWTVVYVFYAMRNDLNLILANKLGFLSFLGRQLLYGTAASHLYFIIIIIQLYLLYPFIRILIQRWARTTLGVSFAVTLLFQTGVYAQLLGHPLLPQFIVPYYIFFPTWLFFFVAGMYAAKNIRVWEKRISVSALLLGLLWLLSFAVLYADNIFTGSYSSSIKPSVMLYCMTSFAFFYSILLKVKNTTSGLGRLLDWFSRQSFIIYFSHILVMKIVLNGSTDLGFVSFFNSTIGVIVLFIVTVVLTSSLAYAVSYTPLARLFGGVRAGNGK